MQFAMPDQRVRDPQGRFAHAGFGNVQGTRPFASPDEMEGQATSGEVVSSDVRSSCSESIAQRTRGEDGKSAAEELGRSST